MDSQAISTCLSWNEYLLFVYGISFCCLFVIAVLIGSSIIYRCSEYINCTVTVHDITSTSSAYAVENTEIIKEQKTSIGDKIQMKGIAQIKTRCLYVARNTTPVKHHCQLT